MAPSMERKDMASKKQKLKLKRPGPKTWKVWLTAAFADIKTKLDIEINYDTKEWSAYWKVSEQQIILTHRPTYCQIIAVAPWAYEDDRITWTAWWSYCSPTQRREAVDAILKDPEHCPLVVSDGVMSDLTFRIAPQNFEAVSILIQRLYQDSQKRRALILAQAIVKGVPKVAFTEAFVKLVATPFGQWLAADDPDPLVVEILGGKSCLK